jgi:hypothetical protein
MVIYRFDIKHPNGFMESPYEFMNRKFDMQLSSWLKVPNNEIDYKKGWIGRKNSYFFTKAGMEAFIKYDLPFIKQKIPKNYKIIKSNYRWINDTNKELIQYKDKFQLVLITGHWLNTKSSTKNKEKIEIKLINKNQI